MIYNHKIYKSNDKTYIKNLKYANGLMIRDDNKDVIILICNIIFNMRSKIRDMYILESSYIEKILSEPRDSTLEYFYTDTFFIKYFHVESIDVEL